MRVDRQLCAHIDYRRANGSTHAVRCWDSCVGPRVHCPEHAEHARQMTGDRHPFRGGGSSDDDGPQCSCDEMLPSPSNDWWQPTLSCRATTIAGVVQPFLETHRPDQWRQHLALFCALLFGAAFLLADI